VVTSYGKSLQAAAALKRSAAYGLDAVNAEDIGKFPTRNAAEALQLVTGVTIDRQRGAGLYVSVRGLGPQFQYVELNGRSIAVNELIENGGAKGRQFRFEVLPSELISQIEVIKTTDRRHG
jgi:iron complex outermembrane receptor protein